MYNRNQSLHFIGIGGVGMAGIAEVLINLGYPISGSDLKEGALVRHLRALGAKIKLGHQKDNIPEGTSFVVYSSAVTEDNPEMLEARLRGIPVIRRAEMLAELMRMKYGIAVGGSHGKTTTTSLIAKVLSDAGLDPTVIVGGRLLNQTSGASIGQGDYLIAESDESDGSFNLLRPAIAVVTNIDNEHLNHYGSFGKLESAFQEFMSSVPFYGLVVGCHDDPVVAALMDTVERRKISYGFAPGVDIRAVDITPDFHGSRFTLECFGQDYGDVSLPIPGSHMVKNALATVAVGIELGVYVDEIIQSLRTFPGVARRAELIGEVDGIQVIDDYGHHPTEIRETLRALRESRTAGGFNGRLFAVFQPHRYSRTKDLFSDFLNCFSSADHVIVTDIYAASETPLEGITGERLAGALEHGSVQYIGELESIPQMLVEQVTTGDIIVTLGAGSVTTLAPKICTLLQARYESGKIHANQR